MNLVKNTLKLLSNKGQTVVEYVLLTAVVVTLIVGLLGMVQRRMLPAGGCTPGNEALGCRLQNIYANFGTFDPNFRYFRLPN